MSKNYVGHRREIAIEQADDPFRWRMLSNASEASNVSEQNCDRLINPAQLERVGVFQHLLHNVLGKKPAVVCAGYFFTCEPFVCSSIFHCDRGLSCYGADQFQIVRLKCSKRIKAVSVECSVNSCLSNQRRAYG